MFKNFLLILITAITLSSLTGCSLFSSDSEEQDTAVAEEEVSEDIEEDVEGSTEETASTDEEETTTETAAVSEDDEEEVVDEYPDDDYGDEEDTFVAKEEKEEAPQKEEETLYVDRSEETPEEPSTYTESTEPVQDSYDGGGMSSGMVSVKKMKKTPYMASGSLINRLYIARDGDSLRSVAEKVYGDSSRSKDLLRWNSHFAGKDLKVGDKVYYSSARSPQDNSAILLYYEEAGVQPSYHTAKNGESIRRVSQKLLGHESSWKEVWATNEVESKWEMPEGTQLRYWPAGTVAAPVQAQAAPTPEPTQPEEEAMPMEDTTTTEVAANNDAPPMEESQPMEEPPPMDDGSGAAGMAQNEPPPPPPSEATPPPPPPPEAIPTPDANSMAQEGAEGGGLADMMGGENDSMMMAVLGGLLLLAAMILVVFIRRGRKKAYG